MTIALHILIKHMGLSENAVYPLFMAILIGQNRDRPSKLVVHCFQTNHLCHLCHLDFHVSTSQAARPSTRPQSAALPAMRVPGAAAAADKATTPARPLTATSRGATSSKVWAWPWLMAEGSRGLLFLGELSPVNSC